MKTDDVKEKFSAVGLQKGNVFLLRPEDARNFVRECRVHSLEIAGIEGFYLRKDHRIQPIQELSTDLGADGFSGDTWERTLNDLEGPFGPDIWFEVVIERRK